MPETFHFERVSCRYGKAAPNSLKDCSFSLEPGERALVLGPSGSGKTTLFRALAGLERPFEGTIRLGSECWSEGRKIFVAAEHRRVGFVFQQLALWSQMTVQQSLVFVSKRSRRESELEAKRLSEVFGMGAKYHCYPHELSGGEAQRLALARALCQDPRFLLLDEALAKLDAPLRRGILHDLLTYLDDEKNLSALFVTHQKSEAHLFSDRVMVLDRGELQVDGSLKELSKEPARKQVAELLDLGAILEGTVKERQAETVLGLVDFRFLGEPFQSGDRLSLLLRPRDWIFEEASEGLGVVTGLESYDGCESVVSVNIAGQLFQGRSKEPYMRGTKVRWSFREALKVLRD